MSIVDWIYPKMCVGCGREGEYICGRCQKKLVQPVPICPMCCDPSLDGWVHARCSSRFSIDRLLVGLPYRGLVQECLKKVKYKNSFDIIHFLYEQCKYPPIALDLIVPIPMWKQKERERGYNQAKILAELIDGKKMDLLIRVRDTKPMFGLKKIERKLNVEGAFAISTDISQSMQHTQINSVLLVDDVWTTGSTMIECAKELKKLGIKNVWALTLAR